MPTYLLDTNAISDLFADRPAIHARLAAVGSANLVITCTIVRGEILHGLERMAPGPKRRTLETKTESFFRRISCAPITPDVADHYAVIKRARHSKGTPLDENDLWIASTAVALGDILVTRDKDFIPTRVLRIENWMA